ncbi:alpha/beta hydrolase family esterase [Herbaspirillum sp. GCM10030257]|uniref:extracellular catalytic domain type 1 short-chain-length polyhydroxyalkanoate depolymerase n=1 Tax=Herbaspirillum sp. GCM10030257 TaxID=3273393 RepID=UPI00360E649C
MKIDEGFLARMREAAQLLQSAGPMAATEAIQRALHGETPTDDQPKPKTSTDTSTQAPNTTASGTAQRPRNPFRAGKWVGKWSPSADRQPVEDVETHTASEPGQFLAGSLTNAAGRRDYKLYVPTSYNGQAMPLIVLLHGCKQNPSDFAAGTGMNKLAEEQGFLVLYPGQAQSANNSGCWNWFQPQDQRRDAGEPSIIADMTRKVIAEYHIDAQRVYVAGLSAGGAMSLVMGATYPDLYAAVGVHSGLPYGVAQDVPSAFAAMSGAKMKTGLPKSTKKPLAPLPKAVPVIVFHGDRDATVHPMNAEQAFMQSAGASKQAADVVSEESGEAGGRRYTRRLRKNAEGTSTAEHWLVHGAGHTWLGGSSRGSYTDPKGPNASQEMLRFFLSQSLPKQ